MPYPRLTKSMPDERRHNPFFLINKALRFGHCRVLSDLAGADFACEGTGARNLAGLESFLQLLDAVAEAQRQTEPAGCPPAPEAAGRETAVAELHSLMRAVRIAAPARRRAAGQALYRCYALFAACDMIRMDAQETSLLCALHRSLPDQSLAAWEAEVFRLLAGALSPLIEAERSAAA